VPSLGPRACALRSPRMESGTEQVSVELARFLPVLPCIEPDGDVPTLLCVEGGLPSALQWLPDRQTLVFLNGGKQYSWTSDEGVRPLDVVGMPYDTFVRSHAGYAAAELASCGGSAIFSVNIDEGTASPVELTSEVVPQLMVALSRRGLLTFGAEMGGKWSATLIGDDDDDDAPPVRLLEGLQPVHGAVVTADESALFLSMGDAVYRCILNVEEGSCSTPEIFYTPEASAMPAPLAVDTDSNLYVCSAGGVDVTDADGELALRVKMPSAATGLCFGGSGVSTLFVSVGQLVYAVRANVQGVAAPSEELLKRMEKQVGAGDFRHVGW